MVRLCECGKPHAARGMCQGCYRRWRDSPAAADATFQPRYPLNSDGYCRACEVLEEAWEDGTLRIEGDVARYAAELGLSPGSLRSHAQRHQLPHPLVALLDRQRNREQKRRRRERQRASAR